MSAEFDINVSPRSNTSGTPVLRVARHAVLHHPPSDPVIVNKHRPYRSKSSSGFCDSILVWKLRTDLYSLVAPAREDNSYPTVIALPIIAPRKPPHGRQRLESRGGVIICIQELLLRQQLIDE